MPETPEEVEAPKKKSKKKLLIPVIVLVLGLGGGGVLLHLELQKGCRRPEHHDDHHPGSDRAAEPDYDQPL